MRPRDRADADAAVATLLRKDAGAELSRCAAATLAGLGIDPDAAIAEARGRVVTSGVAGPLAKAGAAAVRAGVSLDGGGTVQLDMSRREGVDLWVALGDALGGRSM